MRTRFFWKHWTAGYRYTWYFAAGLMILALLFTGVSFFRGNDAVIHWQKLQEQKVIGTTVHTFKKGPFELAVPAENFVIFEYFNGSPLTPNTAASHLYLLVLTLGAVVLLAVITTLDRFWYLAGITLFMLFVLSLRLKVLGIFGQVNYLPSGTLLVAVVGLSAWFNIFRPAMSFFVRLLAFGAVALVTGVLICFFSTVQYPVLHLAVTSYPAAMILTVLFILLVAHEIPATFISLISIAGGSKSLQHFLVINAIYLANLLITAMHETGAIHWNFIYINPYLLLAFSALLGIWGFRQREPQYRRIMPFHPFGAYFFCALGALAFATTGTLLGNANDSALKITGHIIIFSHLGFGFIFFIYVLSNFIGLLGQNMPVHKVLYKPVNMPYFMYQFAGLIATLAFIFYGGWRGYVYNGVSGFYNNLGDLDVKLENNEYALAHYEKAKSYGFQNHHANYALAALTTNTFSMEQAHAYYALANARKPTEYSLVNDGNLHIWDDNAFRAIRTYRRADSVMPGSGIISNNLGFAYGKVLRVDSSVYYLNTARDDRHSKPTAEANFFALAAADYIPLKADSVMRTFDTRYTATVANALAVATIQRQPFTVPADPLAAETLDLYSASLLNNYMVKHLKTLDTAFIRKAWRIADDSVNDDFSEALKVTIAQAYYYKNHVSRALEIMAGLAFVSRAYEGTYNYLMGLWALEQDNAALAAHYFNYAVMHDYKEAALYHAIALAEDGRLREARTAWDSLANSRDEGEREMAARMKTILYADPARAPGLSDPEKYQFCRYRLHVYDTAGFNKLIPTFQNNNYKAKALLDMARRLYGWDKPGAAIRYFRQISGLEITDPALYREARHFELQLLAGQRDVQQLSSLLQEDTTLIQSQYLEKLLYTTLISEAGHDTVLLEKNYGILASHNPYFEEGVIAAADYYRAHSSETLKPYNTLAEAIQVNNQSVKLMNAYIAEALRMGFDNYAADALQQLEEIKARRR